MLECWHKVGPGEDLASKLFIKFIMPYTYVLVCCKTVLVLGIFVVAANPYQFPKILNPCTTTRFLFFFLSSSVFVFSFLAPPHMTPCFICLQPQCCIAPVRRSPYFATALGCLLKCCYRTPNCQCSLDLQRSLSKPTMSFHISLGSHQGRPSLLLVSKNGLLL